MAKILNISAEDVARISGHVEIQSQLSTSDDHYLQQLIRNASVIHANLFYTLSTVDLNGSKILIKRINLASSELTQQNFTSTANLFNLPLYLHYGLGSPGFGAWRELSAATTATNWVLTGLCPNMQMMYYWRVLPKSLSQPTDTNPISDSLKSIEFWGDSPSVLTRYQENSVAEAEIVIFFEYLPHSLEAWLNKKNECGEAGDAHYFDQLDAELTFMIDFLRTHGMLHFDLNLRNIVTNGKRLFLSNFNLALCKNFDLTAAEINFYNRHEGYDDAFAKACLIEWILTRLAAQKSSTATNLLELLQEYKQNNSLRLPDNLDRFVRKYAGVAGMMFNFFNRFKASREARLELSKEV